ncbi:MAG TPA: molybdenum cofactor biosynthesis protein MoaE [Mycobacteriales bacterium]|nr:molybdenum cofactor biosynthesis protein MoaE [Mycobacteriales bacterium]
MSDQPLSPEEHLRAVERVDSGACVVFAGVVRDHDHGRKVVELEYVGHPTAERVLTEVAEQVAADPSVHAVAVSHRLGPLTVGDVALVAAVSAAHRHEAFAACAALVELVKERIPVWKRQVFPDGTDEWVNCA